jgi:phage shock protein PspC (stress-responsive transcriptional regulator)
MSEQQETTQTRPAPANEAGSRRLVRRQGGKWIAGVATGLGDYTGLDPVIFRILFVLLTVAGGIGLLLYGLAWLFIPPDGAEQSVGEHAFRRAGGRASTVFGLILVAAGAIWLFGGAGFWEPELIWAIALVAIGVILLREDDRKTASVPSASTSSQAITSSPATTTSSVTTSPYTAAVDRPEPARPKRAKSYLGRLTIGATLLLLGATAVLDNLGAFDAALDDYFALGLAGIGAGLVVGAWRGRSRGLIFLGVLLLPILLVASLIDVPIRGGVGDRNYSPSSAAEVRDEYRLAAGALNIDLTEVSPGTNALEVAASVGTGNLHVFVPRGVAVTVDGSAGAGLVEIFGRSDQGTDVNLEHSTGEDTTGHIVLDLDVGLGAVWVDRTGTLPTRGQGVNS